MTDTPESLREQVGRTVRTRLFDARKTQADAARAIGNSRGTLSRKLHGAYPFTVDDLEKLAVLLGTTPHELLGGDHTAVAKGLLAERYQGITR